MARDTTTGPGPDEPIAGLVRDVDPVILPEEVAVPARDGVPLSHREATALANRVVRWWHDLPSADKADVVLAGYKASHGEGGAGIAVNAGVDTEALRGAVQRDAVGR